MTFNNDENSTKYHSEWAKKISQNIRNSKDSRDPISTDFIGTEGKFTIEVDRDTRGKRIDKLFER
jgi:hypothetical protein